MKLPKKEKIIIAVAIVFVIVAVIFVFGRNMSVKSDKIRRTDSTVMPEATGTSNEIRRTTIVSQDFVNTSDTISKVGIVFVRASYMQDVHLTLELVAGLFHVACEIYADAFIAHLGKPSGRGNSVSAVIAVSREHKYLCGLIRYPLSYRVSDSSRGVLHEDDSRKTGTRGVLVHVFHSFCRKCVHSR